MDKNPLDFLYCTVTPVNFIPRTFCPCQNVREFLKRGGMGESFSYQPGQFLHKTFGAAVGEQGKYPASRCLPGQFPSLRWRTGKGATGGWGQFPQGDPPFCTPPDRNFVIKKEFCSRFVNKFPLGYRNIWRNLMYFPLQIGRKA